MQSDCLATCNPSDVIYFTYFPKSCPCPIVPRRAVRHPAVVIVELLLLLLPDPPNAGRKSETVAPGTPAPPCRLSCVIGLVRGWFCKLICHVWFGMAVHVVASSDVALCWFAGSVAPFSGSVT